MRPRTAVVLLLLSPAAASAQARVGPEFQVNTYTTGGQRMAAVVLRRLEGEYALRLRCRLDDDSQDDGAFVPITGGPHFVELDWRRSSFPATSNGSCRLAVDGVEVSARTGLDNSVSSVDFVRLGALSVKTGATGTMYWDEFESRRRNPLGP